MATQTLIKPKQDQRVEQEIQQVRKLYADAPHFAKTALENGLAAMMLKASQAQVRAVAQRPQLLRRPQSWRRRLADACCSRDPVSWLRPS